MAAPAPPTVVSKGASSPRRARVHHSSQWDWRPQQVQTEEPLGPRGGKTARRTAPLRVSTRLWVPCCSASAPSCPSTSSSTHRVLPVGVIHSPTSGRRERDRSQQDNQQNWPLPLIAKHQPATNHQPEPPASDHIERDPNSNHPSNTAPLDCARVKAKQTTPTP